MPRGNAGSHPSPVTKTARPGPAKLGLFLYSLPACSPELSRTEPAFQQVKHHDLPTRGFTTRAERCAAVEAGFESYRRRLQAKCDNELRLAA